MEFGLFSIDAFSRGGAVESSWYGNCLPDRDSTVLVELNQPGRIDLDAFVTERIALDEVEAVFDGCAAARCCAPRWCCDPSWRKRKQLPELIGTSRRSEPVDVADAC
ncbi:hypothetical protein GCM10027563_24160 [Parasphingorhabdus pacifica]